jgi:hypothetical protein
MCAIACSRSKGDRFGLEEERSGFVVRGRSHLSDEMIKQGGNRIEFKVRRSSLVRRGAIALTFKLDICTITTSLQSKHLGFFLPL